MHTFPVFFLSAVAGVTVVGHFFIFNRDPTPETPEWIEFEPPPWPKYAGAQPFPIHTGQEAPKDIKFMFNRPHACDATDGESREDPIILTLVASAVKNLKHRMILREAFQPPSFVRRLFVVGRPVKNATRNISCLQGGCEEDGELLDKVMEEARVFGDVLVADFIDVYQNLTIKTIAMLHWKNEYCPKAPILLKQDDDCFVNFELSLRLMDDFVMRRNTRNATSKGFLHSVAKPNLKELGQKPRVFGEVFYGTSKPVRDLDATYYVSYDIYPTEIYPVYARGASYFMSQGLVERILSGSHLVDLFVFEDVWIGTIARLVGGSYASLPSCVGKEKCCHWYKNAKDDPPKESRVFEVQQHFNGCGESLPYIELNKTFTKSHGGLGMLVKSLLGRIVTIV